MMVYLTSSRIHLELFLWLSSMQNGFSNLAQVDPEVSNLRLVQMLVDWMHLAAEDSREHAWR